MTSRHRGGGHKRRLRLIDFKRNRDGIPAVVAALEYDPNRSANIALLHYADGVKTYILAPDGLKVGAKVESGENADIKPGNALMLKNIPLGTVVHAIEMKPGAGAQARARRGRAGAVDGERGQDGAAQAALGRAADGAGGLPRDYRPGRQSRSRKYFDRQGRALAMARQARSCARSRDESG